MGILKINGEKPGVKLRIHAITKRKTAPVSRDRSGFRVIRPKDTVLLPPVERR